jgi:hypothetical protein
MINPCKSTTKTLSNTLCLALIFVTLTFMAESSFAQFKKFTNRHNMCVAVLATAPAYVKFNEDKKYVLNAFRSLKDQSLSHIPASLLASSNKQAEKQVAEDIIIPGGQTLTEDQASALLGRLTGITSASLLSKDFIAFHLHGWREIAPFLGQLQSNYQAFRNIRNRNGNQIWNNFQRSMIPLFVLWHVYNYVQLQRLDISLTDLPPEHFATLAAISGLGWANIFAGNAMNSLITSFRKTDREIPRLLNSIHEAMTIGNSRSIYRTELPPTLGPLRFSYLGFQSTLPKVTVDEALAIYEKIRAHGEANIDMSVLASFATHLKTFPRDGLSKPKNEFYQPKWIGVDMYFDWSNSDQPELFLMMRVLPNQPPAEKVSQKQTKSSGSGTNQRADKLNGLRPSN